MFWNDKTETGEPAVFLCSCCFLFCFDPGKWKRTITICYVISFDVRMNGIISFALLFIVARKPILLYSGVRSVDRLAVDLWQAAYWVWSHHVFALICRFDSREQTEWKAVISLFCHVLSLQAVGKQRLVGNFCSYIIYHIVVYENISLSKKNVQMTSFIDVEEFRIKVLLPLLSCGVVCIQWGLTW